MRTPVFFISANGQDITGRLAGSGISMTITDGVGVKSDTLALVIDDKDGKVVAPKTGAILNPRGGYEGHIRDFGLFIVDAVTYTGFPQQISIQAKSVAAKSLAKQRDPAAYPQKDYPTYGDIFSKVASTVGLSLVMPPPLRAIANIYEAQTEESALEFMMRIAEKIDAEIAVKSNRIVVINRGEGKSATGSPLPDVIVRKGLNLLGYSVTEKDEPKYSEVEATVYDRKKNQKEVIKESTGMEGPTFRLRTPHQDPAEARRKAKAQARKLARDTGEATFEIDGDPFAQAEATAVGSGCRSNVDGRWTIENAVHNFSSSSTYTTSLSCKRPKS